MWREWLDFRVVVLTNMIFFDNVSVSDCLKKETRDNFWKQNLLRNRI